MPCQRGLPATADHRVAASCHLHGKVHRAVLRDISRIGCRAEMDCPDATAGDRVLIEVSELLVLPATIGWIYEEQVGLEFASPMAGAMLGRFALQADADGSAQIGDRQAKEGE